MADRYLLESGAPDGYLLEDGTGVLLLDFVNAPTLTTTFGQIATNTVLTAPLPSTAAAGDLALAFISQDGSATGTWSGSAVELLDHNGTGFNYHIAYLICAGGETDMTCTSTLSERANYISAIVPAATWHGTTPPEISTGATGSSTSADPDSLTPSWGAADTRWIATLAANAGLPMSAWPTNYGDNNVESFGLTSAGELAIATRALNAASDDPATFTMSITNTWSAFTLAVRPALPGTTVTPGTASLVLATFAPTVSTTTHQTVTPGLASLTLTTFAPTVTASNHQTVTPGTASLVTARFAPTVTASDHKSVTPTTQALSLATFAPTVTATANVTLTPTTAALVLASFAPTVAVPVTVTPGIASLTLTAFAPNVATTTHQTVTPTTAALLLSTFAPTVTGGAGLTIVPSPAALALTAFAPNVVLTDHKLVTPDTAALGLATFAPTIVVGGSQTVTPGTASLVLTTFAPTVTGPFVIAGGDGPESYAIAPTIDAAAVAPLPSVTADIPSPSAAARTPRMTVSANHPTPRR